MPEYRSSSEARDFGLGGKRSTQSIYLVAYLSLGFWIAAVLSLDPVKRRRYIRAPSKRARPGRDGSESDRNLLGKGQIGDLFDDISVKIPDLDPIGKTVGRHQVRKWFMHGLHEDILAVR